MSVTEIFDWKTKVNVHLFKFFKSLLITLLSIFISNLSLLNLRGLGLSFQVIGFEFLVFLYHFCHHAFSRFHTILLLFFCVCYGPLPFLNSLFGFESVLICFKFFWKLFVSALFVVMHFIMTSYFMFVDRLLQHYRIELFEYLFHLPF